MKDSVDALQSGSNRQRVANIRVDKLGRGIKKSGRVCSMHLRHQQIQDPHPMPTLDQGVGQMRADKAGAAGN
jgi:hypothetical protein